MAIHNKLKIKDTSIFNSLGWAYLNSGNLELAESLFLKALKTEASNSAATNQFVLNNLGYLYLQKGDTVTAKAYLNASIKNYNSKGAQKILKLVEEYEQREKDADPAHHTP
jgi:Flp pilus assembly protein TadD